MRIGIDCRTIEKKMNGVGRYINNILAELPKYDLKNEYILFSKSKLKIESDYYRYVVTGDNSYPDKIYSPFWLNFVLPKLLRKEKINVFFNPNHLLPGSGLNGIKTLIAVHDVFHKIQKNFHPFSYTFYLNLFLEGSIKRSDSVITVSEHSKKDIIRIFNVPDDKVHVIYPHGDAKFYPTKVDKVTRNSILQRYNISEDRIVLFVGKIENRKNIIGILKIADILIEKNVKCNFVLIGGKGHGYNVIRSAIEKRSSYVKYLQYTDEQTLKIMYNISDVFLFPSYYEGFGIPPLEAMKSGLPVLSSNNSSLLELVGEGGILHNPDDHYAFAQDIERIFNDDELRYNLKERALTQARKFEGEKPVKELVQLFNSLK